MDFSALIAELRNIASSYNGRDIDSNVSTAMYCEMFRKILQKAESEVAAYDDQIVILWMTLSQLCQTYKTLTKCKERNDLYQHIFLLCAKVVLNIKWQQLADDDQSKENFRKTVEATHSQLVHAGFDRFGLLLNIMENPWTDPTITKIMSGDVEEESNSDTEEDENEMSDERKKELEERKKKKIQERDEEFTKYIGSADPLILRLRVEMLMQENCEEWALNLCNCCLKQRRYQMDLEFKSMQLLLLFKLGSMEKLQEVCETIECHHGIYIIEKLEKKENNQSLCVRLIQIFLVQDWIRPDRNCCTKKLLQMWIKYQSMEDKDRDKFLDSVWAIAKISSSTDQVNQLVTGLVKKCGLNLLQLYTDLCVYAINFDKGCCEQQMIQGNMEGVKKQQWAISVTCIKLADLYCNCSPKLARIAALTAFSLNPTIQNFNVVRKTFTDKRKEKMQAVKQDLSEEKGKETPQKEYKPRQSKYLQKVNPATIHEVERLLNMLRPYYLDPEIGFEKLQPVCQKFMDERGGGVSELPKKPNRPQTKTNSNSPRQNADVQFGSDNSAGSSRSNCAPTKSKNPPITTQPAPSPASSLAKSPLFGNKPRSYRAMSQPETVSKPPKTVQSNAIAQRLVPLIQPSPTPQTKTTSIDSTSNISELLKATKTLPQYNPNSSPATSLSYTSPSFVSVPQRMSGVNTQVQSTDLLRRKSVTLPVSTGGAFGRSEIIGDAGDKSIYHHLYKPLKPQEPTSLKTAKPPSNKLQVTNVNNKFQGHPNSYSLGGQANFNSIARPTEGASFAPPAAGVDSRRPSAEELQSIVDWLQSGTEDAISKQSIASFNTAIQQTPPPAHTPQPSYAARGQAVHNSQAHSSLQSGQKVDLNTLLTKPQVVANVLKIHPKGKTAVQEAASQISQRLSDIRSQGDVQLLLNLQKKYGSHQKPVPPNSAPNSDQPVHKKSVNDTKEKKNLTDTDLSLEEMKRRIADIVQKQKLLCENKPDQPAKRRRSDSPKGKKKTTGSSSSTPTKGLKPVSSPAAVATATSESSNTPPQGEVQKQQIKEWFNNRLQVQQQIEKIKQQPPSISSLTKPQFILQQQAAPVHFVSASQIENLRSSSAQRGAGNPRASEGPALHGSPGPPQQKGDHYDQRLGLLSNSASTKPSLLEQKLLQDDSATTASLKDSSMLNSSIPHTPNIHQLRTFQASAQSVSNEGVLPSQLHLPLPNSQANTTGVSQGPGISEGTLPSSDGPTPTTLLSVLLEQSKYITSVAATSASSSPSQSKNFQGGSSQLNTSTWSSTLTNSVLSSLPSTPTSASPIRTSAQQTLSILLPKTAHCGKQDVENSNSDSTSTSSTVDSREKPKDSSLMSPVGYQLKYVGQIKTKDIQSVAKSGNDLLGGNTSGQSIQKSPSGMKLLTCFDNEVVKEISKMIGVEKKQAMPPVEIPIISKSQQQQMENVDSVHCVSVKNNTENSFVTENKQMGEKEVSRLESLGTVVPNEKPTPLTDLKATSEQSQVGVKNYRQSLIDSLENGIKQSMEHIDVSAELLEKSSQNIHPSCIDLDLTREKVPECSESVGDISSTAQPVLPNAQVVQEESTEKLPESQTCMGEMVDRGADSGPKMSSESQTWTDKTIEHGANSDRNSSPLSPAAQPTTHIDQIDPLVSESGSKPEEEWSQEECLDDVANIEVKQSDTSNLLSEKDSVTRNTLNSVPDEVNLKSISEEQPKEAVKEEKSDEKSDEKTDNNIPDSGHFTLESKEEDMLPEAADETSELTENASAETHKEEELDKAEETVKDADHTEETEKPKLNNPIISVDSAILEEKQQGLVVEDSESAGMEDQQMEEESLVEETENNGLITDTVEIGKDEAKEKDLKVEQTEMLCMEDIKLDNIDRSKVIHKLKNDMNNLLHQIEDLNGSHGSRSIAETLSEMNCHEQASENQNVQISKLSETVQKMEEELEEERKKEQDVGDQGSVVTTKSVPLELAEESSEKSEEVGAKEETKARKDEVEETESMSTEFEKEVTPDEKQEEKDLTSHENQEKLEVKSDEEQVIGEFALEEPKVEVESQNAEDRSTDQREGENILLNSVECNGKKGGMEEKDNGSEKITDEEKEIMAEEGNRKLDKFRKNQKNKKTDIPVNFGFDFNEESHGEEMKINKKSSSEDSSSRESEFVKVSPPESKHKRLQGSAILKTKKRYRENLQGAKEVAEKIKEHIISGTKVVEITEKTALPSVIETKAFSADVKKNMPASARVNDPDFDKHSITSNSSSCSSVPSINQMQTIQSNPEKEKGTKEIPEKTNNCLICGKEFRSVMSLKEHVKNKCKSTDYVRTKDYEFSSRFTCCKCGMTSSSPYDMKKHLKRQHNMSDDKDFEDLLISSYKCELCGETFKDKTSIYSHVSTSCPHLGARRKESKLFPDDKRAVKTLPNLVNPNRGKLCSATTNQSPPNNVGFKEKVPVAKAENQRQPKTVSREMKATEVISVKSENTKILSQERVSSPVETAIGKSQIGEKNSEENASLSSQEESQTDSKKKTEPQVSNQRVTRSRLENTSTKKESGSNNAKGTKQQVVEEKSGKKVEDPVKEDNHVEDSSRKLSFDESQNKASVEEEKGPEKSNKKDRSTERKRTNKESPELKTPTARGQTRGKNGKFTPRSSAVPSNEKKEDDSTDLSNSNQDQSQTSKPTYRRHTRSKGTVENVDLSDLEKVEMNFRKSRCRQHSGSTDVSLVSECSEVDQQQKLSEQTKRKKLDNDSCEVKSTSSPAVVAESGQDASSSQRKRKESSSVQPPVETPPRGKRLIKVKKFDQFEVPEFLKSQVINSNLKRQVKTEKVPDKVIQTPAKNETKKEIRKCSRCSKQFANQTKLIKHIATVHLTPCKPSSSSRLQKCSYQCRYCKATYKTYLQFLNHVPGHATQILEGLDSKQIVPAVVHSKPANVKGTEDSGPQKEETENIIKKEEAEENEVKTRSTRQSENKAKPVNEPTENTVATRSRRSTASSENGQGDKANQKAKSSSNSKQEKQVLTSRSRSRSGRGLDNKEEKPEVDLNSPSRQLRRKRDSRGNEKDNDVLKKKQNMQQDNQNTKAQEKQLPQTEEHMTRSSTKRKSESNKSPAPSKKSKTDQPDSTECETSEFELAGSDAEISFRKRMPKKRKVEVNFVDTCGSDIEETAAEEIAEDDDDDYNPAEDEEEEEEDEAIKDDLDNKPSKTKDRCIKKQDTMENNTSNNHKGPEKVPVAVVDDDEFEYVKSPSHETTFNETSKALLHKASEVKEKIVLSRSSKDHTAYLNSFMSYIDNRSKKTKEEKEKVAKTLQQPNKKTVPNKKARLDTDKDNSTDTEERGTTSGTPNQAPTSFLDSFLEHCSKATDGEMSSPSGSVKGEDTKAGEDHVATKTEQKQVKSESKPDAEVKEETACVIGNVDSKVTETGDKTSFNAFQDTFKSFVTAGSKKGSISGEGDSSTRKESLTDVIEGLRDSERTHRAGSEESVQTVSSRCTDISDTSEGAQGSTASKSKRMRHIYHNGKIWHVGAGNVTSMSVKQNDPEGHPLPSSTLTNPITPGMTLATKQLIKVDRDKNTPHQDQSENTYTYTTAEELKRGSQGGSNKWRVKRDKTQLSFRK